MVKINKVTFKQNVFGTMLICPECNTENPDTNKICHNCGLDLVNTTCPECGATVAWSDEICHHCGARQASTMLAIMSEEIPHSDYLDQGKRYQIKSTNIVKYPSLNSSNLFQSIVFDTSPLQKSRLDSMLENLDSDSLDRETLTRIGIPNLALPYLTLEEEFPLSLPKLFDAWREESQEIVILSDFSHRQLISEYWATENISPEIIIQNLKEMALLWKKLSKLGCNYSLLIDHNLRIDRNQNFCLKQIYQNPPNQNINLVHLITKWQELLTKAQNSENKFLEEILISLSNEKIKDINSLQEYLKTLNEPKEVELISIDNNETREYMDIMSEIDDFEDLSTQFINGHEDDEESYGGGDDLPTLVLPMQLLHINDAACTDIGSQRNHNEDCYLINAQTKKIESPQGTKYQARGLYIVCDGMGGHSSGEVASAMAVASLKQYFETHWQGDNLPMEETIRDGILKANETIYNENLKKGSSGNQRMGTTLVVALVQDTKMAIAHVGDSRIYKFSRRWNLEQLTVDHAVAQLEIQKGMDPVTAYARPDAYQLTQALGPRANNMVKPDIQFFEIKEDSLFLLCSDGLSDNDLLENYGETHLSPLLSSKASLDQGLVQLVDFANEKNGHDNITALIIRVKVQPNLDRPPLF